MSDEKELREQVKRFCRTEKAVDNLVALIQQHTDRARIDELKSLAKRSIYSKSTKDYLNGRLAALTKQGKAK